MHPVQNNAGQNLIHIWVLINMVKSVSKIHNVHLRCQTQNTAELAHFQNLLSVRGFGSGVSICLFIPSCRRRHQTSLWSQLDSLLVWRWGVRNSGHLPPWPGSTSPESCHSDRNKTTHVTSLKWTTNAATFYNNGHMNYGNFLAVFVLWHFALL